MSSSMLYKSLPTSSPYCATEIANLNNTKFTPQLGLQNASQVILVPSSAPIIHRLD